MLKPYGLESIGIGIAMFSMIGLIGMPGYKLYKYMSVPGRLHQVKKPRFFGILAVLILVIGLVLFVPIPHYLRCDMVVMPQDIVTIWIRQPGKLESCEVKPGEQVAADQVLARLSNIDLELQLMEARGKVKEKKLERELMINSGAAGQPGAMDRMAEITGEISNLQRYVRTIERQFAEMTLISPIAGTVLDTPYQYQTNGPGEVEDVDQRSLLYGKHDNVSAQRGQRFCEVADLSKWYAVVMLTEHQVKFAQIDQPTKIRLYAQPSTTLESTVESIGETDLSIDRANYEAPAAGQPNQGSLQTRPPDLVTEMVSVFQQQELQYFARVPLPETEFPLKIGLGGQARLFTGYRSLGARLWWWINQNFRL